MVLVQIAHSSVCRCLAMGRRLHDHERKSTLDTERVRGSVLDMPTGTNQSPSNGVFAPTRVCSRGHDKDVTGRKANGRCLECHREDGRARRALKNADMCPHGHDKNTVGRDATGHCRECKRGRAKVARAAKPKRIRITLGPEELRKRKRQRDLLRHRALAAVVPVDGLEDEFGPCAPCESSRTWYDAVAVDRAVSGVRPVGRRLTQLETVEVLRIRAEKDSLDKRLTWAGIRG